MEESTPSGAPEGLVIEAVEWLPSGARSGLVRVRGRWESGAAPAPGLPVLVIAVEEGAHRFASLPDPRGDREPGTWRGAYVVNADLYDEGREALTLEFPGGAVVGLPAPGIPERIGPAAEPAPQPAAGGDLVDPAVFAERRARRAEEAEQAQAKISREAMHAVEVLELRAGELERQLEAITTDRDTLARQAAERTPEHEVDRLRQRLTGYRTRIHELEAELADAREEAARAAAPPGADAELTARAAAAEARAERLREALTAAVGTIAELRGSLREAALQRRTGDLVRTANAVRLAVVEAERGDLAAQLAAARDEVRSAHAAAVEAHQLAVGAEAAHDETRRRFTERVAQLEDARGRLSAMEDELATARETAAREAVAVAEAATAEREAALAARSAALDAVAAEQALAVSDLERRESELRAGLQAREAALQAEVEARVAARQAELAAGFEAREAALQGRLAALEAELAQRREELETTLARERGEWQATEAALLARLQEAESALAGALTARDIADAAAAAADAERQAAVVARAALSEESAFEPGALERLERRLTSEREQRQADHDALRFERARLAELTGNLAAERERIRELEARLAAAQAKPEAAPPPVEEAAPPPAEEATPPPAAPPSVDPLMPDRARVVADLDRAAAALRERAPAVEEPPARPKIVSATTHPPRPVLMGKARRDYPPLRGALVKLAHDDPAAAAQLIRGLLPAHWRPMNRPLDYDLTIGDGPTCRVEVTVAQTRVTPVPAARAGSEGSDFHLHADAVTIAELLAGVIRFGRFRGFRVPWGGRAARALNAVGRSSLSLADVVRDGARLEPALVLRCLAYAVPIAWTKGHDFTIEERIVGPDSEDVVYIAARDVRGLHVTTEAPDAEPDATVVITHTAFDCMLRGETPPPGDRPAVRGDHDAVDALRDWAERVRTGDV